MTVEKKPTRQCIPPYSVLLKYYTHYEGRREITLTPSTLAVLLSPGRTGSIFLCHCLSNHPQIYCPRGSVLGRSFGPRMTLGAWLQGPLTLSVGWAARHYDAAVVKIGYKPSLEVWDYVKERGAKVIHLTRSNYLRTAISQKVYHQGRAGQLDIAPHAYDTQPAPQLRVSPRNILGAMARVKRQVGEKDAFLGSFGAPVLRMTYEDLVGTDGREVDKLMPRAAARICEFLDVDAGYPLYARLRKVVWAPLCEVVDNWDELREHVAESEFAYCLEGT